MAILNENSTFGGFRKVEFGFIKDETHYFRGAKDVFLQLRQKQHFLMILISYRFMYSALCVIIAENLVKISTIRDFWDVAPCRALTTPLLIFLADDFTHT